MNFGKIAIKTLAWFLLVITLTIAGVLFSFFYNFGALTTVADLRADKDKAQEQFGDADAVMNELLAVADNDQGYQALFDGKTLDGWRGIPGFWRVENGEIIGESTTPLENQQFLVSEQTFSDFALKFDFFVDSESLANSGLFYRAEVVNESDLYINGYQGDIDFLTVTNWAGSFYDERSYYNEDGFQSSGKMFTHTGERLWVGSDGGRVVVEQLQDPDTLIGKLKKGEWATYTIVAKGGHFIHRINGEIYSDTIIEDPGRTQGVLALQLHQYMTMTARFRDMRIKTLSKLVDNALLADETSGDDWATYGRTFSMRHYSPLKQIDKSNVGDIGLAWFHDLDVNQRADSQPLAFDGVVYTAAGLSIVQAFDAESGELLWRYDPDVASVAGVRLRTAWGIRGLALWEKLVIVGTQDGRLIALDQKTGELIWSAMTLKPGEESSITGPPRVYNGKVVIGFGGAERAKVRGAVSAWDAATGDFLWRFYTVPGNPADGFENKAMEMAAETWTGDWWKYGGGGTAWHGMTYDREFNQLYIGTGNGGPQNWKIRNPGGGDNLFLASVVALNADTGEYLWHYQENPNEAWDYNSTMDMVLDTIEVDGKPRKVLMHAPKNGFFYVIDRENGKLISAEKVGTQVIWAKEIDIQTGRPVEEPGIRYEEGSVMVWPGAFGAHSWPPMSANPSTGLVYIPMIQDAGSYTSDGVNISEWTPTPGIWNNGLGWPDIQVPFDKFGSSLLAWDPVLQQAAWRIPLPGSWNGGTMTTGGNLVFQGHMDGTLNAYDAQTGDLLWSYNAGVSVLGAPISFMWENTQYISVLSGPPSGPASALLPDTSEFGWRYRGHPRRILTFALNGKTGLPVSPAAKPEQPLADPSFQIDKDLAGSGAVLYHQTCWSCHGIRVVAGGAAPDLRASAISLNREVFTAIVRDGAMLEAGMPSHKEFTDTQIKSLQHYIRSEAHNPNENDTTGVTAGGL
ncbi:MAG: PQQ-dependent dehydrogenase, methanol/ethanol family [Halioglobus sp.]